MGFFSWMTSDTKRSIANTYSDRDTFPVYLIKPDGTYIEETDYEGYGTFGGQDVYKLLAEWNAPEKCNGDLEHDRLIGINLEFNEEEKIKHPIILLERKPNRKIERHEYPKSKSCPDQGFFYPDESSDWDDEDDDY